MSSNKKVDENTPLKVFFITSNQAFIDKDIEIIASKNWMEEFQRIQMMQINLKNEAFTISLFCFTFTQKNLKDKDYDKNSKNYKATATLKYKSNKFEGIILFKKEKNNFIYDFKFNDDKGFIKTTKPPFSIKFSKLEQLKIYGRYINSKKLKQDNPVSIDLIKDSLNYLSLEQYTLEYFLELLKMCYNQNELKSLLMRFKL